MKYLHYVYGTRKQQATRRGGRKLVFEHGLGIVDSRTLHRGGVAIQARRVQLTDNGKALGDWTKSRHCEIEYVDKVLRPVY